MWACNKEKKQHFNPLMGTGFTNIDVPNLPFAIARADPSIEVLIQPYPNSKARVKAYLLTFKDVNIGFLHSEIMMGISTRDILIAILSLQATYNTKIQTLITDAGSALRESSLAKEADLFNEGVKGLKNQTNIHIKNVEANAQFCNPVESGIKTLKKFFRQIFNKVKSDRLPTLTPPELRLIGLIACTAINRQPYPSQDGLLSQLHFVLTSPMYHLLELGPGTDGKIDYKNSYQRLGRYLEVFRQTSILIGVSIQDLYDIHCLLTM